MIRELSVAVSSPTLLTAPELPFILTMNLRMWAVRANLFGYKGIEWRPLRFSKVEHEMKETGSQASLQLITSAEQSYRSERSWKEASDHRNKLLAQVSYCIFPHRTDSLYSLVDLQTSRPEIPITVYPAIDDEERSMHEQIQHKLIQPGPDLVQAWNVNSFEEMIYQYEQRGYGVNLDVFHLLRLKEYFPLPSIESMAKMFVGRVGEIQYSANRLDFGKEDGTPFERQLFAGTKQAYKDVTEKTAYSDEMRLLLAQLEAGFQGPIVTEVLTDRFNPLINLRQHRRIAKTLNDLVNGR